MKALIAIICLFSLNAIADWQTEVSLGIDGETWKIQQAKFSPGKEETLSFGTYILKMTIKKSTQENGLDVTYSLHQTKGEKTLLITKGEDIIEEKSKSEIFAKGQPSQPHSIITLKFKNI
jgi:hypothetical protein